MNDGPPSTPNRVQDDSPNVPGLLPELSHCSLVGSLSLVYQPSGELNRDLARRWTELPLQEDVRDALAR